MASNSSRHIITIAGRPGSGKSSTAKTIAAKLGFKHFSSGELFRTLAKEHGGEVLQANVQAEKNAKIDHLVDEKLRDIYATEDNIVIDSRIAWHWMPLSFKVFLDLDLETAAQRILQELHERRDANENIPQDANTYSQALKERLDSENRRYMMLYNINPSDMSNYNLVVDTKSNNLKAVVSQIISAYKQWLKNKRE